MSAMSLRSRHQASVLRHASKMPGLTMTRPVMWRTVQEVLEVLAIGLEAPTF
jgi:hypothetical protein